MIYIYIYHIVFQLLQTIQGEEIQLQKCMLGKKMIRRATHEVYDKCHVYIVIIAHKYKQ